MILVAAHYSEPYFFSMRNVVLVLLLCLQGILFSEDVPLQDMKENYSLPELEKRLSYIQTTLKELASYTLQSGISSLGHRTSFVKDPLKEETFRIKLESENLIDSIILVPFLYRNDHEGLRSEGFPLCFEIHAGTASSSHKIASFTEESGHLPRIAPLAVSFPPLKASWVMIKAKKLNHTFNSPKIYNMQFSEILVFHGEENIALTPPEKYPRYKRQYQASRQERFLTDGFTPFVMNAANGKSLHAKPIKFSSPGKGESLTLDLKTPQPVQQVNLHTADISLTVPLWQVNCWGTPTHMRIIGSLQKDFAHPIELCEIKLYSIYDFGPIIMRRFPEKRCRYIKIEILDPTPIVTLYEEEIVFAFSEVEILSKGKNIAQGADIKASKNLSYSRDTLPRITDGYNNYGRIISQRSWMEQLARRHELEKELPLVQATLKQYYTDQQIKHKLLQWGLIALLLLSVGTILLVRFFHQRKLTMIRTRFAADLHDELGANLHTIALLSDVAQDAQHNEEEWNMLHRRIRDLVSRTSIAIRHFTNIVNAHGLYEGLIEDMKKISRRIMAKVEHTLEIQGEEYIKLLKTPLQVDLYLFYKESLMNICRHSDATQARTELSATKQEITLRIKDNGKGIAEDNLPASLKRRARLLKAKLKVEHPPEGGTAIFLRVRRPYKHPSKTPKK